MKTFIYVKSLKEDVIKEVKLMKLTQQESENLEVLFQQDPNFISFKTKVLTDEEEIFVDTIENLILDFYDDALWSQKQVSKFIDYSCFYPQETKDFLIKLNANNLDNLSYDFIENISNFIGMDKKWFINYMKDFYLMYETDLYEFLYIR